jgi:hypothetical protein
MDSKLLDMFVDNFVAGLGNGLGTAFSIFPIAIIIMRNDWFNIKKPASQPCISRPCNNKNK